MSGTLQTIARQIQTELVQPAFETPWVKHAALWILQVLCPLLKCAMEAAPLPGPDQVKGCMPEKWRSLLPPHCHDFEQIEAEFLRSPLVKQHKAGSTGIAQRVLPCPSRKAPEGPRRGPISDATERVLPYLSC